MYVCKNYETAYRCREKMVARGVSIQPQENFLVSSEVILNLNRNVLNGKI